MSFGIALSGGGAKGAAHVGVLLALAEENLLPTSIAGTSSGSIVAGLYSVGVKPTEMKKIIYNLSKYGTDLLDPSYKEIISAGMSLLTSKEIYLTGLMKGNKLEKFINNYTKNKKIEDVKIPIIIPTVDLNSGKTVVFTNVKNNLPTLNKVIWENDIKLSKAIRASSSVPGIFEPIFIKKYCLVDGGLTDVLPVDLLIASGEKNVIAVDISEEYEKPDNSNLLETMMHSFYIMRDRMQESKKQNQKLTIKPILPDSAGLLTFKTMIKCMESGYDATKRMMTEIKKLG